MPSTFINSVRAIFDAERIEMAAAIPFSACRVTNPEKLAQRGVAESQSVLVFLVPYYAGAASMNGSDSAHRPNISNYAAARDYHVYFKGFFERVCAKLHETFPEYRFSGSADNAPIDERHAAVTAGLGMYGDSGLLINEIYGTYVFIGEIFSDMPWEQYYDHCTTPFEPQHAVCMHCGACKKHCPMYDNPFGVNRCLSEVTQTKNLETLAAGSAAFSARDCIDLIRYYGSAWGCDRCQTFCPYNKEARITPIPFFLEALTPHLTAEQVQTMPDAVFAERAYAWRKKSTIVRNLEILEADAAAGLPCAAALEDILSAIRNAGAFMRTAHDVEQETGSITEKTGDANFVTVYDVRVQEMLMKALQNILPHAQFFAEEKENDPAMLTTGDTFIIDPIDGTTNFIHNYGISAISVGLLHNGIPVFGAVYNPYREKMYEARRGIGAFCNGKKMHVSSRPPHKGVFAVGTAPYYRSILGDNTFAVMRRLFDLGADIRRLGSAALDLCAVASGVADGYVELRISPWDFAAGALLVTEAGGVITDTDGNPLDFKHACPVGVIAGTPSTHVALLEAVHAAYKKGNI